jgi:hypothetical protein
MAVTTTVPFMLGWIEQWYGNVPAAVNVCENDFVGLMGLESHTFVLDVDVCAVRSPLVHVTVVPAATVIEGGLKAKFLIETAPAVAMAFILGECIAPPMAGFIVESAATAGPATAKASAAPRATAVIRIRTI